MIETNEPKDGDFIAYIEQLQKQQAARLIANTGQAGIAETAEQAKSMPDSGPFEQRGTSNAVGGPRVERERLRRSAPPFARLIAAALPLLVGAVIGLHWLIAGTSPLQLIIAVVLVVYGARRFKRVLQELNSAEQAKAAAPIAQLFAKSNKR
jgi:hypothetical protein